MTRPSEAEQTMAAAITKAEFPAPVREYRFATPRRFRFDFAWPEWMVALEVEGGSWVNGAHTRGAHFEQDAVKYNEAALAGWTVLRVTPAMVRDGRAVAFLDRALVP